MRILFFSTAFLPAEAHGGVPFSTFYLARELQSVGHEVKVITSDRNGPRRLQVETDVWTTYQDLPVVYCKTWPGPYIFAPQMPKIAEHEAGTTDIIVSSATLWNHAGLIARRISNRFNKPNVLYIRGLLNPRALQHKPLRKKVFWFLQGKKILDNASSVIALRPSEREAILQQSSNTPVEVIPNGIRLSDLEKVISRGELDDILPQIRNKKFLLYLGRISKPKGFDILLPAFKQAIGDSEETKLVACGPMDPIYQAEFNSLIERNKLQDQVVLAGIVNGEVKNSLLHYAACLTLTSYTEAFPVSVLEALAVGRPVILTHQCNLPEVRESNAGWIVSPDIPSIFAAVSELLDRPGGAFEKGLNGKELVQRNFLWENVAKTTTDVFMRLVDGESMSERLDKIVA
jgi:glycosyltransferase involved in cell wall biosynthesis